MDKEILVHLFHLIIVGGLFLYVGIMRDHIPKIVYPILFGLGIIITLYHIYKTFNYMRKGSSYWVNLIHVLLVGPLLIFIGYHKENTRRLYFELLLMLGFAAIGYHGYYIIPRTEE